MPPDSTAPPNKRLRLRGWITLTPDPIARPQLNKNILQKLAGRGPQAYAAGRVHGSIGQQQQAASTAGSNQSKRSGRTGVVRACARGNDDDDVPATLWEGTHGTSGAGTHG
jgi:hypothetical protein